MALRKRSIQIAGHRTSVSLEDAFWDELGAIARERGLSLPALVAEVDRARTGAAGGVPPTLSGALRLYVLDRLRRAAGRAVTGSPSASAADRRCRG